MAQMTRLGLKVYKGRGMRIKKYKPNPGNAPGRNLKYMLGAFLGVWINP